MGFEFFSIFKYFLLAFFRFDFFDDIFETILGV